MGIPETLKAEWYWQKTNKIAKTGEKSDAQPRDKKYPDYYLGLIMVVGAVFTLTSLSGGWVAVPLSSRRMESGFELLLSQVIWLQLSMERFV